MTKKKRLFALGASSDCNHKVEGNMRMRYGVILVVIGYMILLWYAEGWGADWKLYGVDDDKCNYYYDVASVKTLSKGIKTVWTKMQAKNDKCILYNIKMRTAIFGLSVKGYKNYSYTMALGKINCALKKASTETVTDYNNEGNVLHSITPSAEYWEAIVPGSVAYLLYEQICK